MHWTLLAYTFAGLALLGLVVPGLPTTPFVLLAAWAASRGSRRLHAWLHGHPRLGPALRDWEQQRAVSTRAKLLALAFLAASWAIMYARGTSPVVLALTGLLFAGVGAFVATRPAPQDRRADDGRSSRYPGARDRHSLSSQVRMSSLDDEFPLGDGTADLSADVACPHCGELVQLAVDPGGGPVQEYVEDCEVCCRPMRLTVTWDSGGAAHVAAEPEE